LVHHQTQGLSDLFNILKDKVNDSNKGVARLSIEILGKLIKALGDKSKN
jgi:hypothetical protein